MNQTSFFNSAQTFQFLSVINYVNTLSNIFYDHHLIESKQKFQQFDIINAYFEYLNRSTDEIGAKRILAQKLLQGTDFYGGNQNETLDMNYIDATFEYIISNIVFIDYGNVYGYLAKIVNMSNNLTLSFLKQEVFNDLKKLEYLNPDGTVTKLSPLSSVRIRDDFIWPLFPEPKHDMNVTDIDYIYAQAGLIFAQWAHLNSGNLTFNDYVLLSQTLELVLQNTTNRLALAVFTLPALLFNASKETETMMDKKYLGERLRNGTFLIEIVNNLFVYLNETFLSIYQKEREINPVDQFRIAMSEYKNRTILAEELLREKCHLPKNGGYKTAIDSYKLFASSTKCWNNESILLPNIDEIFQNQIDRIREKYRNFMAHLIQQVFYENELVEVINSTKTIVLESQVVPIPVYCYPSACPPYQQVLKRNVYLFALRRTDGDSYYALVNNEDTLSLLSHNQNRQEFFKKVHLPEDTRLEISPVGRILKSPTETFERFVNRLAELKAGEFANQLHSNGYDRTVEEKIVDVLLAFVPFYNCIRFAKAGNNVGATFSCLGDIINWMPFAGQLIQLGGKIATTAFNQLLIATGVSIRTFAARQAIIFSLKLGLREAAFGLASVANSALLTKEMFQSLSIGFLRAVDPGFELLSRTAILGKLFQKAWTTAAKKYSFLNFSKYKTILQDLMSKTSVKSSHLMQGKIEGFDLFRYRYPGGVNPMGPKIVRLPNGNAELRRVIGFSVEKPVVVSRITKTGKVYYRKIDLGTKNTYGLEMELNNKGVLQPVRVSFRRHIATIMREGLSGRGKIILARRQSIVAAADMMSTADPTITRQSIYSFLSHYVLAVERPIVPENLADLVIDSNLQMEIDPVNPETLRKYLGSSIDVDPALENYLITPTYHDFALDWIRTRKVHNLYHKYYVQHSVTLSKWRNDVILDMIKPGNLEIAKLRLTFAYGKDFPNMVSSDLATILHNYDSHGVREFGDFIDYFALLMYEKNGFYPGLPKRVTNYMRNALYKVAVKQIDGELLDFPREIFAFEISTLEEFNQKFLGQRLTMTNSFLGASDVEIHLNKLLESFIAGNNQIAVKYQIQLNSHYFVVLLNRIVPSVKTNIVILPNVVFNVDEIVRKGNFILVKMHNRPISKELCLARIMNDLKVIR